MKNKNLSIKGSSIYNNVVVYLYANSIFGSPEGTSYGSGVKLYGDNKTYIYGYMEFIYTLIFIQI